MGRKLQKTVVVEAGQQFTSTSVDLDEFLADFPIKLLELDFACGPESKNVAITKRDRNGNRMSTLHSATASTATSFRLQGPPHDPILQPGGESVQVETTGATAEMRLNLLFEVL